MRMDSVTVTLRPLTTLPITVLVFRRLSLVSLAANMTILPLQPGLMFLDSLLNE